jgi:hypothetical protein
VDDVDQIKQIVFEIITISDEADSFRIAVCTVPGIADDSHACEADVGFGSKGEILTASR